MKKTTAEEDLYELFFKVKKEGDCKKYVSEMCTQLELLGTETNTLTRNMIFNKLQKVIDKIQKTF